MPKKVIDIHAKIMIRANRLVMSSRQLALFIGCSKTPVQNYMKHAKILVPTEARLRFRSEALTGRTIFSLEEDMMLRKEYLNIPVKVLAKKIGHSHTCIRNRMRQLGLIVPVELAEQRKKRTQFKYGSVSHNKGCKQSDYMTPEMIERTKKTRFKSGITPHNTLFNGAIRTRKDSKTKRPYQYIRIKKGKWQLLQRYLWEKHNGPIKKGFVVAFKDGDPLNCTIKNLECISTAENGSRTAEKIHQRPPELKIAIRLKNKLTQKVKQYENKEHP